MDEKVRPTLWKVVLSPQLASLYVSINRVCLVKSWLCLYFVKVFLFFLAIFCWSYENELVKIVL